MKNQLDAKRKSGMQIFGSRNIFAIFFIFLLFIILGWRLLNVSKTNDSTYSSKQIKTENNFTSLLTSSATTTINVPFLSDNAQFSSQELGINFTYPNELGPAQERPASKGKGGSLISGEEWWRIGFNKRGFEPGYYEISASTQNYKPEDWEGNPHWLNVKVSATDSEESVKQKVSSAGFQVVKVQKTKSFINIPAFKVWVVECYSDCQLSRAYITPLLNNRYNNLLIYTIIKNLDANNINEGIINTEKIYEIAVSEISSIENDQAGELSKKYIAWQDLIFNSLIINY